MNNLSENDIVTLIKKDDDDIKIALMAYTTIDLKSVLDKLRNPIKLSFTQRLLARALNINTIIEQNRFVKLLADALSTRPDKEEACNVPVCNSPSVVD